MLSIVIPAWNEEKYLPILLECINQQAYKDYEIIVADAASTDNTPKIARRYGCKIVKGGMPAVGRNNGAKAAKGEILLFLDADVQFDENFIMKSIDEFKRRKLDVAGVYITPSSRKIIDKIYLGIFNCCIFVTQLFYSSAFGGGIFCKKWLHKKVSGFDDTIILGEDTDYVRRCAKFGKFRIMNNVKIYFSMRRFDKEGRIKLGFRYLLATLYSLSFSKIRTDLFKYNMKYKR